MTTIVQKYGGSSLADVERLRRAARRVLATTRRDARVVVVVSAMGSTTDQLCALAAGISPVPPARELDTLLATGECAAAAAMAIVLHDLGHPARSFTGWQAGVVTDGSHGNACVLEVNASPVRQCLDEGTIPVVAGFQGISRSGAITTLGRCGSDTTAVALAAALGASRCEILTDVDGVFTADPRTDLTARFIPHLSYEQMQLAANNGARVLHARCVEYARRHGVPIHVRSSFHDREGTWVTAQPPAPPHLIPSNPRRGQPPLNGGHPSPLPNATDASAQKCLTSSARAMPVEPRTGTAAR